jgi:hypothetical protein
MLSKRVQSKFRINLLKILKNAGLCANKKIDVKHLGYRKASKNVLT